MQGSIAVCFYGFLRSHKGCIERWKENVLEPLNADIFICCPNIVYATPSTDSWASKENVEEVKSEYLYGIYGERLKGLQILNYNPEQFKKLVSYYGLPENNMWGGVAHPNQFAWRIFSMFNHIRLSLELCNNYQIDSNIQYDNLILARPDLFIENRYNLDILDPDIVYSSGDHQALVLNTDKWISDHLLISKQENIMKLSSIYENIANYHKEGIVLNQETLIGFHLMKNNIKFERSNFSQHHIKDYLLHLKNIQLS
jgi:hypothetical protein